MWVAGGEGAVSILLLGAGLAALRLSDLSLPVAMAPGSAEPSPLPLCNSFQSWHLSGCERACGPRACQSFSSKCFVSSPRCRCKFSPLVFNHGGCSEVHPFTFLMCSTLLFSADTFVNNSFLQLPPSFNSDYFLVS